VLAPRPAPLFTAPLSINDVYVGEAIIDTGGGYELMLRDSFGLQIVGEIEVLAFGGFETVSMTEGFRYSVDGWSTQAETALVGLSVCDCNGVGFDFFRKTGVGLGLDFATLTVTFGPSPPVGGVTLPFAPPPPLLSNFDSAFIEVAVVAGGQWTTVLGLLDTGTNSSVMRRSLAAAAAPSSPNRAKVLVNHPELGTVAANVLLFDTPGLPDIILGTDIMRAWSDEWYFSFTERSGTVTTVPRYDVDNGSPGAAKPVQD
jgi:hypothetical protein